MSGWMKLAQLLYAKREDTPDAELIEQTAEHRLKTQGKVVDVNNVEINPRKEDGHGSGSGTPTYVSVVGDSTGGATETTLAAFKTEAKSESDATQAILTSTENRLITAVDRLAEIISKLNGGLPAALDGTRLATAANVKFDDTDVTPLNPLPVDVGANIEIDNLTVNFDNQVPDLSALLATPFGANETRESSVYDMLEYAGFKAIVWADAASAVDGAKVLWSESNTGPFIYEDAATLPANLMMPFGTPRKARYAKFVYINGAIAQTVPMRVGLIFAFQPLSGGIAPLASVIHDFTSAGTNVSANYGRFTGPSVSYPKGLWLPQGITAQGESKIADSGEQEYTPGLSGGTVTSIGDTIIYTASAGKAFRVRSISAIPVLRGSEEAPVLTMKILNSDNSVYSTPMVGAILSKRKKITGPTDGKIAINLDIASRVPWTLDIEEYTP